MAQVTHRALARHMGLPSPFPRALQPSELSLGGSRLLQTFLCLQCFAWDAVANMCNKAMEAVGRQAAGRLSAGRRNPAAQQVGQMTARA